MECISKMCHFFLGACAETTIILYWDQWDSQLDVWELASTSMTFREVSPHPHAPWHRKQFEINALFPFILLALEIAGVLENGACGNTEARIVTLCNGSWNQWTMFCRNQIMCMKWNSIMKLFLYLKQLRGL